MRRGRRPRQESAPLIIPRPRAALKTGFTGRLPLLSIDPEFFADFPTRNMQPLDYKGRKAAVGDAANTFLKRGVPGFKLRGTPRRGPAPPRQAEQVTPLSTYDAVMEEAVRTVGSDSRPQAQAEAEVEAEAGSEPEAATEAATETQAEAGT